MSGTVTVSGTLVGSRLGSLLMADDIVPGSETGYEVCKAIYAYHPIGKKMVDGPIQAAQSLPREMSVPAGPEKLLRERFDEEWEKMTGAWATSRATLWRACHGSTTSESARKNEK